MTDIGTGRGAVLDIGALLADRMLTITGADDVHACAPRVSRAAGGLVITGDKKPVQLTALASVFPGLPLFREPVAPSQYTATAAAPFDLSDPGELFGLTLDQVLDGQRAGGASGAITPTGFIPPGDADPMKAAVEAANLLDREDAVLWMPCHYRWACEPGVAQLIAIARRSRHPVALSLSDPKNPLDHKGVPLGLRRVVAEVPGLIPWRIDLAGIDALAHGARATAIGILPSTRHITEPGTRGYASKPGEKAPHIFLTDMLRFVRADRMRDDWFASTPAPTCDCAVCAGQPVDRFDRTDRSRLAGHLHNVVELTDLHARLLQAGQSRRLWWRDRLDDARAAHQELEGRVSTRVQFPAVLDVWSKN
jgi:hypothetical protein